MTKIECYTENCEYNLCNICNADVVNFDDKGNCLTKEKRAGGVLAQSFADIEAGEDFNLANCTCDIKCENESCCFNCSCSCNNDNIKVDDGILKTNCVSKQKRKK